MTPTANYGTMYPASVVLPDGTTHRRCKVFATDQGLYVYTDVPGQGDEPAWSSPIDMANTVRMPTGYRARLGWEVATAAGTVTVTHEGGCGCGRKLNRWLPGFARIRQAWPANR